MGKPFVNLVGPIRGEPLMIWEGGSGREFAMSSFFLANRLMSFLSDMWDAVFIFISGSDIDIGAVNVGRKKALSLFVF